MKRWQKWTIGIVVLALAVAVGGPLIYKLFNKADPKAEKDFAELADKAGSATTIGKFDGLAGTWATLTPDVAAADEFYVGYRVNEVLFGQKVTATGRTSEVAGTLTFDDTALKAAEFTAQLASVTSDESRRDNQFRGRIMSVDQFPTATFTLTKPVDVSTVPADGVVFTFLATGNFTVHGVTKEVTIELQAFHSGAQITVTGNLPIVFADYGIPNPSFGPADTEDHGSMEFLLTFAKSA